MDNTQSSVIIGCKPHPKYDRVFLLNGLQLLEDRPFFKYMCYDRLVNSVEASELVFVSPETWLDPFERRFWKTSFEKYNYQQPEIACMCVTNKSATNEEAAWKMYADNKEKALRISFNRDTFLCALNKYAKENDCKIYIGKVIYTYNKKQIIGLHNQVNPFFPNSNEFTDCHYLTLMCIKRKAFAFENEIRIFIVKRTLNWHGKLLKIPVIINNALIPRIVIGPLPPFGCNDPRQEIYKEMQKIESVTHKRQLRNLIPKCDIVQSQLYISSLLEKI
ncbi:MAG: DUF2971 domain-containing protein [Alistipes senegalensis]|nr:DUF2971 domain-containing protein [Bacteroides cellulosilyticus]MCM1351721.1 DUF2971 domain-containing protein [Alistipes senegalensis]